MLLVQVTGATFVSLIGGVWSGGIRRNYISKGETGARLDWMATTPGLSGREAGRMAGTAGGQTETRKIFSVGKGCAYLWRSVPGRDRGGTGVTEKLIRFGTFNIQNV